MLRTLITQQVLFYVAGGILVIALIVHIISAVSIKRLVNAAEDMGKSNHPLMKLIRSKYEHACMVNDKVQNVRALVDKYVYEYRVWGLRLYSWRKLKLICVWLYALLCIAGAFGAYAFGLMRLEVSRYIVLGAAGVLAITVLHLLLDEEYKLKAAKIYMIDFLGNTYAHRYEKMNQKSKKESAPAVAVSSAKVNVEEQITEEQEPAKGAQTKKSQSGASAQETKTHATQICGAQTHEEEKESSKGKDGIDAAKEAKIREILGEFLA